MKTIKVGINGFGRIGRLVLRRRDEIHVVARLARRQFQRHRRAVLAARERDHVHLSLLLGKVLDPIAEHSPVHGHVKLLRFQSRLLIGREFHGRSNLT